MKTVKMRFLGVSPDGLIGRLLFKHFNLDTGASPDFVIGTNQTPYDARYERCVKIIFSGENATPNFNDWDYATGFDHLSFGDRYLRLPLFAMRAKDFHLLIDRKALRPDAELLNRKFCSFIVSNSNYSNPIRRKFFERLSQYKKVDSGGRYLNNVGGPVKDKLDFCRGYKFNIAFENSAYPGYTTEKIMEAYAAESVPIYFGNPTIETDFRLESMVRVKDESDIERAVEEIIRLDNDDAAYLAKCHERCFAVEDPMVYERELESFLVHIFEQPLEQARRRARYGHQAMMREHMRKLMKIDKWIGKARKVLHV